MKCHTILLSCAQGEDGVRGELGPVAQGHDHAGFWPLCSIKTISSRATRRPEIDVSGIAAKHTRVTSTVDDIQDAESPSARRAGHRDEIQRPAGVEQAASDPGSAHASPAARRRPRRLRTVRPFFAIEPVDAVDPGRFAVLPQQDEQRR